MARRNMDEMKMRAIGLMSPATESSGVWNLGIGELAGKNLESAGREEVNEMLADGWLLLHVYTLKYREDGTWRERPMAILGRPSR